VDISQALEISAEKRAKGRGDWTTSPDHLHKGTRRAPEASVEPSLFYPAKPYHHFEATGGKTLQSIRQARSSPGGRMLVTRTFESIRAQTRTSRGASDHTRAGPKQTAIRGDRGRGLSLRSRKKRRLDARRCNLFRPCSKGGP